MKRFLVAGMLGLGLAACAGARTPVQDPPAATPVAPSTQPAAHVDAPAAPAPGVVGAHEVPMNTELADKMGTTVQLTGKIVSRNGMQMIEVSADRKASCSSRCPRCRRLRVSLA